MRPEDQIAFDMYFASIASMQEHPGAGTKEHRKLSLDECCQKAVEMVTLRRKAFEEKENP